MKINIFDLDGTLTKSKEKILDNHISILDKFLSRDSYNILMSGASRDQIFKQLPKCLILKFDEVHPLSLNKFTLSQSTTSLCLDTILRFITDNQIDVSLTHEIRSNCMLNVSFSLKEKHYFSLKENHCLVDLFSEFDKTTNFRINIILLLKKIFPFLKISLGGRRSIDIGHSGKEDIITHLVKREVDFLDVTLYDDGIKEYGNSFELSKQLKKRGSILYLVDDVDTLYLHLQKSMCLNEC